jgi:hypothetical protein
VEFSNNREKTNKSDIGASPNILRAALQSRAGNSKRQEKRGDTNDDAEKEKELLGDVFARKTIGILGYFDV